MAQICHGLCSVRPYLFIENSHFGRTINPRGFLINELWLNQQQPSTSLVLEPLAPSPVITVATHFNELKFFYLLPVPPLYVRIQGLNHPLVSGVATRISCSSAGARPEPDIVWNKDSNEIQTMIRGASKTVSFPFKQFTCERERTD